MALDMSRCSQVECVAENYDNIWNVEHAYIEISSICLEIHLANQVPLMGPVVSAMTLHGWQNLL